MAATHPLATATYRANPDDTNESKIETAEYEGGIPHRSGAGDVKVVKRAAGGAPYKDVAGVIKSHDDAINRFDRDDVGKP